MSERERVAVVALGGNAISSPDEREDIHDQFRRTRESMDGVLPLIQNGYRLAITHGNGPQVGRALMRNEIARGRVPELPLGVLVAGTEGWMGYMIEQCLMNEMNKYGISKPVISVVSQVLVDENDPSLQDPTKYVGQVYSDFDARKMTAEFGWAMKFDKGRDGWRRVVGSPTPLEIINRDAVRQLLKDNWIVICVGGGGVPAYRRSDGWLEGVDAVIDKDYASAVLAKDIGAQELFILTGVPKVFLNYGRADQQQLDKITVAEAKEFLRIGHFPAGSMGPKMGAAIQFLENGGERVVITDMEHIGAALEGDEGTIILP